MCANSPSSVQASLQAIRATVAIHDEAGWDATTAALAAIADSDDLREGIAAFLEKRQPQWTGSAQIPSAQIPSAQVPSAPAPSVPAPGIPVADNDALRPQRRSRAIAMTPAEIDEFMATERVCRLASVGAQGAPHVSPLWYVWHDGSFWIYSIVRSKRWADINRTPTVSAVVDAGSAFGELRGVEVSVNAEIVGEVPRTGESCPELDEPERQLVSWDHRKSARLNP